jgi:hypothetical protein
MRPSTMMLVAWLGCAACAYRPGSFQRRLGPPMPGERATVGCLDVAVQPRAELEATGQVIEVSFANRCDHPTVVDFAAMRATTRHGGAERALRIYDPHGEIRPLKLEARTVASEVVELQIASRPEETVANACVDVGGLARWDGGERWICVAGTEVVR